MNRFFLINGIALALVMLVFILVLWLRFSASWSAGQEPGFGGDDEPVERCGLRAEAGF